MTSIALVHEQLYDSKNLATLDFAGYLRRLVQAVAVQFRRPDVAVVVEAQGAALDLQAAVPCGLIVNELVTNCFKHAFPAGRGGTVRVGMSAGDAGGWAITVEDDGVGLPAAAAVGQASTLGLKLVAALAGQLHGTVALSRERGARVSIAFGGTSEQGGRRGDAQENSGR